MKPFRFPMGGVWEFRVKARMKDGTAVLSRFKIVVKGPPWAPGHR